MDSEIQRDGRVLDLTDDAWREDRLPYEDVTIPLVNVNAKVNVNKDQRLQKAEMFFPFMRGHSIISSFLLNANDVD